MAAAPGTPSADPALSIETPERVALSLDVAGLGTRSLAYLVDALLLFLFWVALYFVLSLARADVITFDGFRALRSVVQAVIVLGAFALQWGYWTFFETLWGGRSPGKRALRIRVVRLEGAPETFADAALRNLGRWIDFLPLAYAVGLASMIVSPRSRRLGDLLAGTVVVRERQVDLSRYDGAGKVGEVAPHALDLSPAELELVLGFVARAATLDPEARARVALKLAEPLARRLPDEARARVLETAAAAEAFLGALVAGRG